MVFEWYFFVRVHNKLYDVFVVYTYCETSGIKYTPADKLREYWQHSGIADAKLIVIGMTSNGFSIADPDDPNMLDMPGFDSNGPQIMKDFIGGFITEGRAVHESGGFTNTGGDDQMETNSPVGFSQQAEEQQMM